MARARNLKPSFFLNTDLANLEPLARILFAGLWCLADRKGRLEDNSLKIKAQLLPYDNVDVDKLLTLLHNSKLIIRYKKRTDKYIQIVNFEKHQYPHVKEPESTIPAPDKNSSSPVPIRLNPESPILNPESPNLIIADKPQNSQVAPLPPKELTPIQRVVNCWRRTLEIPKEDVKTWEKANYGRCSKSAKLLLEIFGFTECTPGELETIADCMVETYDGLKKAGLECTLETVVKRAHEWRIKNGITHDPVAAE